MKHSTTSMFSFILMMSFITVWNISCKKERLPAPEQVEEQIAARAANSQSSLSHTKKYSSDVANEWFSLLANNSRTNRFPPAPSIRIFAYSSIAMYESVVPGMPSYQSIYKSFTNNTIDVGHKKDYYWPAAANAALARISEKIIRNYNANIDLSAMRQLETSFNASFQNEVSPELLQLSINFGKNVADKIYDWSTTDGTLTANGSLAICPPYVPLNIPGTWVPTPAGFFPAAGACQGNLRTFIPDIVNTTLPPPPFILFNKSVVRFLQNGKRSLPD